MSGKIALLSDEKITYEGVFNLKELYEHLHDWLEWRKYDVEEKKYKEKVKPGGKEIEIEWAATRSIDEYSQFMIELKWLIINLEDVEVQKEGRKVKMNKAEINIKVSATLVLDYDNKWETQYFQAFLKAFYENYLYKSTIDDLKEKLWNEGWNLHNEIKAFLNLYRYI